MGSNGARYLPQLGSPYNYQLALKNVVIMVTLVCDGGYEVGTLMLFWSVTTRCSWVAGHVPARITQR